MTEHTSPDPADAAPLPAPNAATENDHAGDDAAVAEAIEKDIAEEHLPHLGATG